eukprot:174833-Amphidinium_carterae.1
MDAFIQACVAQSQRLYEAFPSQQPAQPKGSGKGKEKNKRPLDSVLQPAAKTAKVGDPLVAAEVAKVEPLAAAPEMVPNLLLRLVRHSEGLQCVLYAWLD